MICLPALVYLLYGITTIVDDINNELTNAAIIRTFVVLFFTFCLESLCIVNMSVVSWAFVLLPFLSTGLLVATILFHIGLDISYGPNLLHPQQKNSKSQYLFTSKYYDTFFA